MRMQSETPLSSRVVSRGGANVLRHQGLALFGAYAHRNGSTYARRIPHIDSIGVTAGLIPARSTAGCDTDAKSVGIAQGAVEVDFCGRAVRN